MSRVEQFKNRFWSGNEAKLAIVDDLHSDRASVRKDRVAEIYRNAPLFRSLHDPTHFEGRCGFCEYSALCGGSRARAFEATGNPLASDPFCPYEPQPKPTRMGKPTPE